MDLGDPTKGAHKIPERPRNPRRLAVGAGLSVGVALGAGAAAQAAPFTVTNLDPSGTGSLADAVSQANLTTAADQITFQAGLSGAITLTTQLGITEPVTIEGPGADLLTVSGGNVDRVFSVATGTDAVTLSGMTITGGKAGSAGGGGVLVTSGDVTIRFSTISGNSAPAATTPKGGGVAAYAGATVLIANSTVSGNNTSGNGAGLWASSADVGIVNSTISGNTATGTGLGSGLGYGGGIWLDDGASGSLVAYGATISGNGAYAGGGITAAGSSNQLANTVIANNTAVDRPDLRAAGVDPFKLAFSLVETPPGVGEAIDITGFAGSNIFGIDPQLGSLADYGGPTETLRPARTSPLLDKGITLGAPSDQRSSPRPIDLPSIANSTVMLADGADIGAVELTLAEATPPATPSAPAPSATGRRAAALKKCKKKKTAKARKKCKKKARKLPL